MKEHPILMRGDMVNAILDGKKRQTRRPIRWRSKRADEVHDNETEGNMLMETKSGGMWPYYVYEGMEIPILCPYGEPGDYLWVKETWRPWNDLDLWDVVQYRADMKIRKPKILDENQGYRFHEDCEETISDQVDGNDTKWRPSIFMPRWASRVALEIIRVRVERLNDISEADAEAEGFMSGAVFQAYYETIHGEGTWNENPWVWVIDFKKVPASEAEKATSPK